MITHGQHITLCAESTWDGILSKPLTMPLESG